MFAVRADVQCKLVDKLASCVVDFGDNTAFPIAETQRHLTVGGIRHDVDWQGI